MGYEDLMKQLQQAKLRLQHQNSIIEKGIAVSDSDIEELQFLIRSLESDISSVKQSEMRSRCDSESLLIMCDECKCWKLDRCIGGWNATS
jgi:hypothetical protein